MVWLLGLIGPTTFGMTLLAQQTGGGSSVTEVIVAFGVISGLSGAVVKLWTENKRLQTKIEELVEQTLPALGEAIAEMRETRREREVTGKVVERMSKVLDKIEPILRRRA